MDSSFTERWIRKFRIITLSLIFSGALNIGLIAAFVAMLVQDREKTFSVSAPRAAEKVEESSNLALLTNYSHLTFRELCALLTNADIVEEGFHKRDLALSALVAFHDFNLEKAIGGMPAQKRAIQLNEITIEMYPNISDDQIQAILHYAYLEQWPLTSQGLFKVMQKGPKPRDAALVQAFILTPEYYALQTLFQKSEAAANQDQLLDLVCDGNWQLLDGFVREQAQMLDLSVERRRRLLLSYLAQKSPTAADLLLQTDFTFALKRLDDQGLVDLLIAAPMSETLQKFCVELLQSARSDAIHQKSAEWLYRLAKEEMPQPFDCAKAVARFCPPPAVHPQIVPAAPPVAQKKEATAPVSARDAAHRTHVVKEGDSLWKIARHYHVKLDELIAINHLEKDKIKPGMVLKIPTSQGRPG